METDRIKQMFGICRKAGKLSLGFPAVALALQKKTVLSVFVSKDASPRTVKQITQKCSYYSVPLETLPFSGVEIGDAVGVSSPVAVLGVCDRGLSEKLSSLLREEP